MYTKLLFNILFILANILSMAVFYLIIDNTVHNILLDIPTLYKYEPIYKLGSLLTAIKITHIIDRTIIRD